MCDSVVLCGGGKVVLCEKDCLSCKDKDLLADGEVCMDDAVGG